METYAVTHVTDFAENIGYGERPSVGISGDYRARYQVPCIERGCSK